MKILERERRFRTKLTSKLRSIYEILVYRYKRYVLRLGHRHKRKKQTKKEIVKLSLYLSFSLLCVCCHLTHEAPQCWCRRLPQSFRSTLLPGTMLRFLARSLHFLLVVSRSFVCWWTSQKRLERKERSVCWEG